MDMRDFLTAFLVGAVVAVGLVGPAWAAPAACFYAPFEGSVEPAAAAGSRVLPEKAPWKFAPGKIAQGLLVAEDGSAPALLYRAEANIRPEAGTVCFWFQPAWSDDDPSIKDDYRNLVNVGGAGGSARPTRRPVGPRRTSARPPTPWSAPTAPGCRAGCASTSSTTCAP